MVYSLQWAGGCDAHLLPPLYRFDCDASVFPTLVSRPSTCIVLRMRLITSAAFLLAAQLAFLSSAEAQTQRSNFSGTWEARSKDSVICTLKVKAGESTSGSVSGCSINVDSEGNLIPPESSDAAADTTPMLKPTIRDKTLSFECKDDDNAEPTQFELRLLRDGVADLHVIDAPILIKPIRFTRVRAD